MFEIQQADRLRKLPPYLFKELDRLRDEAVKRGVDIINLGVGDPDQPTPVNIVDRLAKAAREPKNHQYPSYSGMNDFRLSVASWLSKRFGLNLDPFKEILTLIGSKEGIAHTPLAFINPGDLALVPEPAYPVYHIGTMFAGGESYFMPLKKENGFVPDLEAIPTEVAQKARLMFINYPNNPTGATAELDYYEQVVEFALKHEIIVLADAAYSEMAFDGYKPVSFLQAPGAMEVGLEFHSLSKAYNMTGWRIGWAAGRPELVDGLGRVKSNVDSGAFNAIQTAGIEALEGDQTPAAEMRAMYARRRDVLIKGLKEAGLEVEPPKATFYVWAGIPADFSSADFSSRLLREAGVICTPGSGFGPSGEGYVRFALTVSEVRLQEAVDRIMELNL